MKKINIFLILITFAFLAGCARGPVGSLQESACNITWGLIGMSYDKCYKTHYYIKDASGKKKEVTYSQWYNYTMKKNAELEKKYRYEAYKRTKGFEGFYTDKHGKETDLIKLNIPEFCNHNQLCITQQETALKTLKKYYINTSDNIKDFCHTWEDGLKKYYGDGYRTLAKCMGHLAKATDYCKHSYEGQFMTVDLCISRELSYMKYFNKLVSGSSRYPDHSAGHAFSHCTQWAKQNDPDGIFYYAWSQCVGTLWSLTPNDLM